MQKVVFLLLLALFVCSAAAAQQPAGTATVDAVKTEEKPKRKVFRATKAQINEAQTLLKAKGTFSGEATGKMSDDFRASVKGFQGDNGLRKTGTLNRATLEKMGIALTENQKEIPVSPNSFTSADLKTDKPKKRGPIFRATKDQIAEAQKLLKDKSLYAGEETGKLDDPTREALKKFQEANAVKVTGTLNQITLEKMGIALTEKQKEAAASSQK